MKSEQVRIAVEFFQSGGCAPERVPKGLVRAGTGANALVNQPTGVIAELVPSVDPTTARVGDIVTFQLRFEGKPVAGAQISAISSGSEPFASRRKTAITGRDGKMAIRIEKTGLYFIGTVHMVRRTGEQGAKAADWESFWVSLTFSAVG